MKRTKYTKRLIILTNDPSVTAWGYAVLDADEVLDAGCIKTESHAKKLRIRKGDDDVRRIQEINQTLLSVIQTHNVNYILAELPHGSQNASAAKMIGMTAAVLQTLSDVLGIGIEWYSEADAKKAVLGKITGTKQQMIDRITELYFDVSWTGIKYRDEAVADALAIHYAATKSSSVLTLFKND